MSQLKTLDSMGLVMVNFGLFFFLLGHFLFFCFFLSFLTINTTEGLVLVSVGTRGKDTCLVCV